MLWEFSPKLESEVYGCGTQPGQTSLGETFDSSGAGVKTPAMKHMMNLERTCVT